jgi:hypothetical protein
MDPEHGLDVTELLVELSRGLDEALLQLAIHEMTSGAALVAHVRFLKAIIASRIARRAVIMASSYADAPAMSGCHRLQGFN